MSLPGKIRTAIREIFSPPGPAIYGERRQLRIVVISILAGIVLAVVFGFVLYHLNVSHRF
jgi:hypothetical protein